MFLFLDAAVCGPEFPASGVPRGALGLSDPKRWTSGEEPACPPQPKRQRGDRLESSAFASTVSVFGALFKPPGFFSCQVLASNALTALCASSSGEIGCAYAEQEEVDVLLQALQSPCMNVRDAALRVSRGCFLSLSRAGGAFQ